MKTIQFRCKLLSDVILNVKAATEGNQNTLDFIPGNNFLGIVASVYDKFDRKKQLDLFHNGTIRYGDAHPVNNGSKTRSLRIPASMFYPKLLSVYEKCYIHHAYNRTQDHDGDDGNPQQLKQSREGFYEFNDGVGTNVVTPKSFAIKSAYDRSQRRASDSQMFGYESLRKGAEFLFEVETDCDDYEKEILDNLVGTHQIGRSRTAQYGLVEITVDQFCQPESTKQFFEYDGKKYVTIYADSRLIFLDENGEPMFQPTADAFGLDGIIRYDLSQIRTFQYAPWNYKRQTRDTDRCGIEKGSVFVVEVPNGFKMNDTTSSYVGNYNNEGFGHVIFNPSFLAADISKNGQSLVSMKKADVSESETQQKGTLSGTPLLAFVAQKKKEAAAVSVIYAEVNAFVNEHQNRFRGGQFASQWGAIRSLATTSSDYDDLKRKLISNVVQVARSPSPDDDRTFVERDRAYLAHGVAAERWKKQGRRTCFEEFVNHIYADYLDDFGDITVQAVINLASEMAKICKQ